ncbi:Zn-ribbon domain-containing OB-fold protein [Pseudonocardia spinosispora]|uniref:Zn-ribbon domain-containing OB-fold protein n=1 Tax=Pseudonocardia spinosispora TaxID=103441 RepID=UPI000418F55D|nr:zinc ribbon domain-containing protein [Pseudonocardia spinosispora]
MPPEILGSVPIGLAEIVERHGRAVAEGDQHATLNDFRPDRIGQLVASASLPEQLVGSEVLRLTAEPDGKVTALIRYTAADGERIVLRSRWVELAEGWRVHHVRNLPETPPRLPAEGPADDGLDTPHWDGLRAGELRIQRCTACGEWIWAPRPMCPVCHSFELGWPAVAPRGEIYSWTRTWQPFAPQLSGHLPFVVVVVELAEAGGRRLVGVLRDGESAALRVGQPVKGDFDPPPDEHGWPLLRWQLA